MAKFNSVVKTGVQSPIKTTTRTVNADGKPAWLRDEKSELFLLAVSNFVGQDTFYEKAKQRDDRFATLVRSVAVSDVDWTHEFVNWLRNGAQMRSASVVAAAEAANAILTTRGPSKGSVNWPRRLVASSMARADEPGEFLAYWTGKFGKNLPQSVKKGVADAANRLYNEYSLLKYDTESKGFRFADVIQLSHAKAAYPKQNDVFQYALDRRYGKDEIPASLEMIKNRKALMSLQGDFSPKRLIQNRAHAAMMFQKAGMTWEAVSGWLQGPMDKAAWEAVIPSMGYMALLRNLRNFQDAGIDKAVLNPVLDKLADADEVAKSRQFPFRFLSAYQANKGTLRIASALEDALDASLSNVPALSGRTLILVDRSGSMFGAPDKSTGLSWADSAAIFGTALALRAENADLVQFGSAWRDAGYESVSFKKGDSILPLLGKFKDMGGTDTARAVRDNFKGHDRVIILTDEQYNGYGGDPTASVPSSVPVYTWNLAGYRAAQSESGSKKRHTFGGLTDKAWQMIPLLEAGQTGVWPWDLVN